MINCSSDHGLAIRVRQEKLKNFKKDFLATVHVTKKIALVKREKLKLEQALNFMKNLDVCKKRGGQ